MSAPAEPVLIRQAYRYAITPTAEQEQRLLQYSGAARFAYNWGLGLVKLRLDLRASLGPGVPVPWSYKALCSEWARVKDEVAPWRDQVIVGSFQTGLEALGSGIQNFSNARRSGRKVGFPRFRAKGRSPERVFSQDAKPIDARLVSFPKLGQIRTRERTIKLARLLEQDPNARILRGTISRSARGKWSISFQVERSAKTTRARKPRSCVGIDLGLTSLATLSTGEHVGNSRPLAKAQRRLRAAQRQLDRQRRANNRGNYLPDGRIRPGPKAWVESGRMRRSRDRVARLHERVANVRSTQAHQLSRRIVDEHGVIGIESLNVAGMLKNGSLARSIADAGWGEIARQLTYKSAWAGSLLVSADSFYPSSKTCSGCQTAKSKLSLSERTFTCEACGLEIDRDLNAALNLAELARISAQAEGIDQPYVARVRRETQNARGGHISPGFQAGQRPAKREGSTFEPSRLCKQPAGVLA